MKRIKLFIIAFISFLSLTGCNDYLDRDINVEITEKQAFENYRFAEYVANSVYAHLRSGLTEVGDAMLASASDEAEFTDQAGIIQKFNNGGWNAADLPDNPWNSYYEGIRKANNFILNSDRINYDDVKLNPSEQELYHERLNNIRNYVHECHLLKAYYIFELIKRYGGVPIIDKLYDFDEDISELKRNTLQECVDYIIFWCDSTAKVLPEKQTDENLGRLTSVAAKAIKSQVLLYAASDLWNNTSWAQGYTNPELISLQGGSRAERWNAAMQTGKDAVLAAEKLHSLESSYTNLFNAENFKSSEVIISRRAGDSNNFEKINLPIGFDFVTGGNCPTLDMVDAFQYTITDGNKHVISTDFDWNNPTHRADPFSKRDPRLEASIVLNNTMFKNRIIEIWEGGRDGDGNKNSTPTGFYLKKYVNPSLDLTIDQKSVHSWSILRLPEVYLNYIEALYEVDPGHSDLKTYYNKIRKRANMQTVESGTPTREQIRKERRVELCFEGKRWFDVRRWMIADQVLGGPVRKLKIVKTGDTFTYTPEILENRVFEKKMYFYPIPMSEINKMPLMVQNPLWN